MNTTTITCPHCKQPFETSNAIQHQIEEELQQARTEQAESIRKSMTMLSKNKGFHCGTIRKKPVNPDQVSE